MSADTSAPLPLLGQGPAATVPGCVVEHGPQDTQGEADEACITCSDQAVEVTVLELLADGMARVDTGSTVEDVDVQLVDAAVGDRILVHAKVAIGHAG